MQKTFVPRTSFEETLALKVPPQKKIPTLKDPVQQDILNSVQETLALKAAVRQKNSAFCADKPSLEDSCAGNVIP